MIASRIFSKVLPDTVDELHDLLKEGTLAERRTFIRNFVKEIIVTGDEAVLSYSMPTLPGKVVIGKEGVLPTVQYGGRYEGIRQALNLADKALSPDISRQVILPVYWINSNRDYGHPF